MIISRPIHVMESRSHWLRATSSYLPSWLAMEGVDQAAAQALRLNSGNACSSSRWEAARIDAGLPVGGALRSWLNSWRGIGAVERGV